VANNRKGTLGKPGTNAIEAMMKAAVINGWLVLRNCLDKSWPTLRLDEILVTKKPELTEIIMEGIWLTKPSPMDRID